MVSEPPLISMCQTRYGPACSVDPCDRPDLVLTLSYSNDAIFENANLRYLSLSLDFDVVSRLPSLCSLLWNLQTLLVDEVYSDKYTMALSLFDSVKLQHSPN
ncbi:hypothetical protein ACS0TY_023498 [Phlomoides rotata]